MLWKFHDQTGSRDEIPVYRELIRLISTGGEEVVGDALVNLLGLDEFNDEITLFLASLLEDASAKNREWIVPALGYIEKRVELLESYAFAHVWTASDHWKTRFMRVLARCESARLKEFIGLASRDASPAFERWRVHCMYRSDPSDARGRKLYALVRHANSKRFILESIELFIEKGHFLPECLQLIEELLQSKDREVRYEAGHILATNTSWIRDEFESTGTPILEWLRRNKRFLYRVSSPETRGWWWINEEARKLGRDVDVRTGKLRPKGDKK